MPYKVYLCRETENDHHGDLPFAIWNEYFVRPLLPRQSAWEKWCSGKIKIPEEFHRIFLHPPRHGPPRVDRLIPSLWRDREGVPVPSGATFTCICREGHKENCHLLPLAVLLQKAGWQVYLDGQPLTSSAVGCSL